VCDDGDGIDTNSCTNSCENHRCGDGIVDPAAGEECDDNNTNDNDDCRNDCIVNRCGDGIRNTDGAHHEDCESATVQVPNSHTLTSAESPNCNANCTTPSCGDGIVNHQFVTGPGKTEQCDDALTAGNDDSKDCTHDCQINVCGDDHKNTAGSLARREDCDDGNRIDTDACTNDCKAARCGDGIVDPDLHEECDDHGTANNDGCSSTCKVEFCGDGIVQSSEECDPGSVGGFSATCNPNCKLSKCGDGVVNPLSHPKDGNGDPIVGLVEQCDDGANVEGDGCSKLCQFEKCGNGFMDPGEDCDDGNGVDTDDCTNACKNAACGDNIHKTSGTRLPNEDCDDGNQVTESCSYGAASCTVCNSTCHNGPGIVTKCGDGLVQPANEVCDDGNSLSCGTCQNSCGKAVAASAATATIFAGTSADFHDNDTLVMSDGVPGVPAVTFTFKHTPTATTDIRISGTDSFTMAGNIQDTINAVGLRITATRQGQTGLVSLVNHQPSASGNTTVSVTGNVASANTSLFTNFSGGGAANCGAGTGCRSDADCALNRCDAGDHTCKKCTANTDCASSNCDVVSGQCQVCTEDSDCIGTNRACTVATGVCHAAPGIAGE
jgi:cysteine-rich repeat protein